MFWQTLVFAQIPEAMPSHKSAQTLLLAPCQIILYPAEIAFPESPMSLKTVDMAIAPLAFVPIARKVASTQPILAAISPTQRLVARMSFSLASPPSLSPQLQQLQPQFRRAMIKG